MINKFKKGICLIVTAAMLLSLTSCGKKEEADAPQAPESESQTAPQPTYSVKAKSYKKSETVYVNMNADGKVTEKTVTDWLHTDSPETYIDDISDLKEIANVKNDIKPVEKDGAIRWNMQTTDLYYRGKTDKTLPINFKIDYYLDGKQMKADEIAGKSGQIKLVITVNNESKQEVTIDGKKATVYTPFIVAGGMVLEEEKFSGVTVENGKAIGDGTKEIALIVGAPGLKESLMLSDEMLKALGDFDFSNTYTITAQTDCFEISNMIFAAIPLSAIEAEISDALPGTVADVKETLAKIQSIMDKFESMNVTELMDSLFGNADKLTELTESIGEVSELYNENKALIAVLEKYMTPQNIKAIQDFINTTQDVDLKEVADLLSNPILQKFFKQLPAISDGMKDVMPIFDGLSEDLSDPAVQKALDNLPKTLETLKGLKKTLDENQELFNTLGDALDEETIASLKEILGSLDGMMSDDLIEKYASIAGDADTLVARAKAWIDAGNEYTIFTSAAKDAQTSVMFVYETTPVSAPAPTASEQVAAPKEDNAVKAWFKNLFKKKD